MIHKFMQQRSEAHMQLFMNNLWTDWNKEKNEGKQDNTQVKEHCIFGVHN